jgi:hypothetical protein
MDSDIKDLCNAVKNVDCFSQEACSGICAIAGLTLLALENPDTGLETIAAALRDIVYKADVLMNDINAEAERVGCNFVDEKERAREDRRRAAFAASRTQRAKDQEVSHV